MNDLHDHVRANRDYWNGNAPDWVAAGEKAWASETACWGIWQLRDADLRLLPDDMTGLRAIELGCGTGYGSAWMTRRGAECVGVDVSAEQLATARRLADEHGLDIEWIEASAEAVPLHEGEFDFVFSEYGAAIWCEPRAWLREARRLLRPGGRIVFLGCHPLASVCSPEDGTRVQTQLHRSWFDLGAIDWRDVEIDPGGIEFSLGHGAWWALFRELGLVVDDYLELRAPETVDEERFWIAADWARRFPSEQVWKLRKPE